MSDSVPHPEMESQKRRTTRIVQAVPLTVTGVDALGRPFQERTSTLIINCHGCRYQSKHYVLKNMWVTFEVPHPEAGREPRHVRARVTWIQRPRTVRELFQIGVELEVPGNIWGIAFPPGDWFPFPETPIPQEFPAPAEETETPSPAAEWLEEAAAGRAASEAEEDNVRVLPLPGGADMSLQLARQVARLVVEAKQQVQSTVREAASRAVAAETRPLLAALENQLKTAAEKSAEAAVAAHMERLQQQDRERMDSEREAGLASLRGEFSRQMNSLLGEARARIDEQFGEVGRARQAEFERQVQAEIAGAAEKLKAVTGGLGANTGEVRAAIEELRRDSEETAAIELHRWRGLIDQKAAEGRERLAHLEQATKRLYDQIVAATSTAEAGWRGQLEADLAAASARWNEKMETSLEGAARQMAERLTRQAEGSAQELEGRLQQRVQAIGSAFSQATADAENILNTLRASIGQETSRSQATIAQLQRTANQLEARRNDLSAFIQSVSEELARRSEALLEAQSHEMNRRAETAVADMTARLQPVLESAGRETITRLANELEQRLDPQIAGAKEILSRLALDQSQAEKALAEHQRQVWQASERSVQDSVARAKEILAEVEKEFAESARNNATKWLSDLETKATETTHTTFEALFKSAEWYEKKVQAQMQASLEKGLDQAATGLRDKAREMSGLFASELDHYSRSYVEHSRDQLEENGRDAAERASLQMAQAGDAAAGEFRERADQLIREKFEQAAAKANADFEQHAARIEAHTAQVRSKLESDSRSTAGEFQRVLSQQAQQTVAQGRQELTSQVDQAKGSLRAEAQSLDRQMQTSMQSLTAHAMDEYKQRLENASNSWLVTTVTKLNQQSENLIDRLAATTEQRLRGVCSTVVAEVGETLRRRLTGLFPGDAPAPNAPHPPEDQS
jgi:hypothetical protein